MRRSLVLVTFALFVAACGDNRKPEDEQPGPSDVDVPHGSPAARTMTCETLAASADVCTVTKGSTSTLIKGNVLTSAVLYKGGQVAINPEGKITCVGCNCAAGGETAIVCPDAAISPGLINTHDHITYTHNDPYLPDAAQAAERYENRQQWRTGKDGHYEIKYKSGAKAEQIQWGELRFVMGGGTSIVGSGSQPGLLRNLDEVLDRQEGLGHKDVNFDTFPLDDANGAQQTDSCNYGMNPTTEATLSSTDAYEPHTSEGIDVFAHNEFLCESSATYDTMAPGVSHNLLLGKTAMIHAIGLKPEDYAAMAAAGTGLIWSPRSNITLYGETARVTEATRFGVEIALGTDWMPSGSMNLLRELACADSFNTAYLNKFFTDQQLWEMVTVNAASVTATDDAIGTLAAGKQADIAIFASHGKEPFRSVIEAEPKDVALVMRGGKVLYGDDAAVTALAETCDAVDVCGTGKRACTLSEVGKTYDALNATAGIYPAFQCGVPMNEPSCLPTRPASVAGSTIYTGVAGDSDSDGDGIPDADDNCPKVFNPIRPLDNGVQGDSDGDGRGDACDPCPLDADSTTCEVADYLDRDGDGVANAVDNCANLDNKDQADVDKDGKGDMCDACPDDANPGVAGCPATIYTIKSGMTPVGRGVRVTNALVTGRASNGFFVQVKETDAGYTVPDNSGLFVFTRSAPPAKVVAGSRVTIDGTVTLFSGELELDSVLNIAVTSTETEAPPAPVAVSYADVKTGAVRATTLEGVIVTVGLSTVSAVDTMFPPEFTLTDETGSSLIVDDLLFKSAVPLINQEIKSVTGVLAFRNSASKIEPRSAADLVIGRPGLKAIAPALAFARVGLTNDAVTIPVPMTITLFGPAQGDTTVTLTSGDATKLTVTDVVIPDGATTAPIKVTAIAQSAAVTITATLRGTTTTAQVRVLDTAEQATTVTLSPATASLAPNGSVTLTATLNTPAAGPTVVTLAALPVDAGTLPATITVLDNQTSATFTFADTAPTGTSIAITATFGTSTSTSTLTVVASSGLDHLLISQVYGGGGNANATFTTDFIELHNPTAGPLPLAGMSVQYASSAGSSWNNKTDLPDVMIPAGGYYLIAENSGTVGAPLPTPDLPAGASTINLSGTNGKVALTSTTVVLTGNCPTAGVIDFVGYGSADCSEGNMATPVLTNTTSAQRGNDGCADTNNNKNDFTTATPVPRNKDTAAKICN